VSFVSAAAKELVMMLMSWKYSASAHSWAVKKAFGVEVYGGHKRA
jgi:hypothetical protein